MSKINDLIAAKKYEAAADLMYISFLNLLNTYCRDIVLTREEMDQVAPYFVEKLQDPTAKPHEPTPEPGDDVVIDSPFRKLTIQFAGPKDDEVFVAPDDVVKELAMGAKYSYAVPNIAGYTPDKTVVEGKMADKDVTVTVTYEKKVEPTPEPKTYVITVTFAGPEGDTEFIKPSDIIEEYEENEEYLIAVPAVEGYTPDTNKIDGVATEDKDYKVTYTKNAPLQELEGEDEGIEEG